MPVTGQELPLTRTDEIFDWAVFGFDVIPVNRVDKATSTKWTPWLEKLLATLDDGDKLYDLIKQTWKTDTLDVGHIVNNTLFVLDADTQESLAALEAIEAAHSVEPKLIIQTAKGEHHYFKRDPETTYARQQGYSSTNHPERIDVKTGRSDTDGRAMVIIPPSQNKSVRLNECDSIDDLSFVDQDFIDAVFKHNGQEAPRKPEPRQAGESVYTGAPKAKEVGEILKHIPSDLDYSEWLKVLMGLHDKFNGSDTGLEIAIAWSETTNADASAEVESKWTSFNSDGSGGLTTFNTVAKMAENNGADLSAISVDAMNHVPCSTPEELAAALTKAAQVTPQPPVSSNPHFPDGLVGEIAQHTIDTAHRKQPLAALVSALVSVAHFSDNSFVVERYDTRLNLYAMLLGDTGSGKDHPLNMGQKLAKTVKLETSCKEGVASGPAILRALGVEPSLLLSLDEVSGLIKAANSENHSFQRDLADEMLKLYNKAGSIHTGKIYANKKDNVDPIEYPFLSIMSATTPAMFMDATTQLDTDNGFLNRFLVARMPDTPKSRAPDKTDIPQPLIDSIKKLTDLSNTLKHLGKTNLNPTAKKPRVITLEQGLPLDKFSDDCDAKISTSLQGGLYGRALQNSLKVAGIVAVGIDCDKPHITADIWQWASEFVLSCIDGVAAGIEKERVVSDFDGQCKKAMSFVDNVRSSNDTQYLTHSKLGHANHSWLLKRMKCNTRELGGIIATLVERGDLLKFEKGEGRGKTVFYKSA
tara:strand:+ start:6955 stop:9219 length:2265 start_codon:yes stop_codon:yes gene_type:complete